MRIITSLSAFLYRAVRPLLFRTDCEDAHDYASRLAAYVSRHRILKAPLARMLQVRSPLIETSAGGIHVLTPVGLAAGYDYEGRVARFMPVLSFGFTTVGTATYGAYAGNPRPRMGRLVQTRSLAVNKGFKNPGIDRVLVEMGTAPFEAPTGLSIGQTNRAYHDVGEAIEEVAAAFRKARDSKVPFAYYELNISCPNLTAAIDFYAPNRFDALLTRITKTPLDRPLWIKMPISRTDKETHALLEVCVEHKVSAAVLGNLQTRRDVAGVVPEESARYPAGNLSGMPTQARSDELIALAYRSFGTRLAIVGCGGIFSAEDAYRKIRRGASLTELVTGLIWQGPQLPSEIAQGLVERLKRDGFSNLRDAVGVDA